MTLYNHNIHHRHSIRLQEYDYSDTGLYFITICCENRACLFGNVADGEMILNEIGFIARECWLEIPDHFPDVSLHEFIIMPNHIHGIVEIVGANKHSPHNMETNVCDQNGVMINFIQNDQFIKIV